MKKRGVKGLGPRTAKGGRTPKDAAKPLQIFAEGDRGSTTPCRCSAAASSRGSRTAGVPILNLAKAGDEVRYMLGVKERKLLVEQFTNGCPAGGPWDAMLFSGGGNDIVETRWRSGSGTSTRRAAGGADPPGAFDAALTLVRAATRT